MAVGVGGLLMDIMNPSAKMGQALAGPSPNPQPLTGGAPGANDGSGAIPAGATAQAPQNGPQQAPAQTYAPDPTNASTIDKLMSLYQNEARANDINRNIALMGSAFGTAQQQHDAMTAISGMPQGGGGVLQALNEAQGIQKQQLANEEASRFAAGSATLLQTLGIVKDPTAAATIGNNPALTQKMIEEDFVNKSPTEAIKTYNQLHDKMIAQGFTEAEFNRQVPVSMLLSGIAGNNLDDVAYRQYAAQASAAGQTPLNPIAWKTQAGEVQKFKDEGKEDFSTADQKLKDSEDAVNALLKNVDVTRTALSKPDMFTTGKMAANTPDWLANWEGATPEVKAAATAAKTLINQLSAEGLSSVKNLRNQREFNSVAGAKTAALDPNNPDLAGALQAIKTRIARARAQTYATAGKQIPYEYKGLADQDLLDPNKPYYTGATEEEPPKDGGGGPPTQGGKTLGGSELDQVKKALADYPDRRQEILSTVRKNGYDPGGL